MFNLILLSLSFHRRLRSFPNSLEDLGIRFVISSSKKSFSFILLSKYVNDFIYFKFFPYICIGVSGNRWTGGGFLTSQYCFGRGRGWWFTSVSFMLMVKLKALHCNRETVDEILGFWKWCCCKCININKQYITYDRSSKKIPGHLTNISAPHFFPV